MEVWNTLPELLQVIVLAICGAFVGGQVNRGIYRLAWNPRAISPWSAPPEDAAPRPAWSRLPLVGWRGLQGEGDVHGRGFWVRPVLIELLLTGAYPALYLWIMSGGLCSATVWRLGVEPETLLAQFVSLATLAPLLVMATFIDFDEQTIPDGVTIPGTIAGLLFAALMPASGLPVVERSETTRTVQVSVLNIASPSPWDESWDGQDGLTIGLACFAAWCVAIAPRFWTTRRGWRNAVRYLAANFWRSGWPLPLAAGWVTGSLAIWACWWEGGWHWHGLLSSLIGLAFGGGLVWLIRIIASTALGEEAMGFGDVTLMAMIGAFLGWQPSLLVFFLAPVAALFVSIAQWLISGRRDIAFGPYLCVAAVGVVGRWGTLWEGWGVNFFAMGALIPAALVCCLALMAVLLSIWGSIKRRLASD